MNPVPVDRTEDPMARKLSLPSLLLFLTLLAAGCGATQRCPDCLEPSPELIHEAHVDLARVDPSCTTAQGALFPWRAVDARLARGEMLRKTAADIATAALGVSTLDYRLMQLPKLEIVKGCAQTSCFVWVCTNRKWLRTPFQTASASVGTTNNIPALERLARQECRVNLARQLLPASMVVESVTGSDGKLEQAIREVMKVKDEAIAVRYSDTHWEGQSVVRVGCWIDKSGW
jgi:hypothetical protein